MSKFLIEVPHGEDKLSCIRAVQIFLSSGSHFLTNADWGCRDGEHKAWLVVDVDNKESARQILPPSYRSEAKIVYLNKFTREEMDGAFKKYHL
jgi:hypothetical protein